MLVVAFFKWWYGAGWLLMISKVGHKAQRILDGYSVGQLVTSLFAPFKQISAGRVEGPPGVRLRAFGDQLLSRVIGAIVRGGLIVIGLATVTVYCIFGLTMITVWPFLPVLPVLGMYLMTMGVGL